MSKGEKISKCSDCGGKLHKLGTIGLIRFSRCESCGKEHAKKLKKASLDKTVSGTLRECITCNAKYAAAGDPDLCPDCHSSFTGRTAADSENVARVPAPKNCDFCDMTGKRVRASYDGKTNGGGWGYMCEAHFQEHGVGLGVGRGQKLVVEGQKKLKNQDLGETVTEEFPVIKKEPAYIPPVEAPPIEQPVEPEPVQEPEPISTPEEDPVTVPDFVPDEFPDEAPVEPAPPVKEPEKIPVGVEDETDIKNKKDKREMVTASDNAHPNGELTDLIAQQRQDTSRWQDGENHSPNPNVDPSSLKGQSEAPAVERISETSVESGPKVERTPDTFLAKVFVGENEELNGAKVLLQDGEFQVVGSVEVEAEDGFLVNWRTGRKSIEKKANYELVIVSKDESECPDHPGQPKDGCLGCESIQSVKDDYDPLDDDNEIYYPREN